MRREYAYRLVCEIGEITLGQSPAQRQELRQPLELAAADSRIHVGQVELAPRVGHVARPVGQVGDAVEAQCLDPLRLRLVVDDQRATLDRRDVFVRMKAEGREIAKGTDVAP